MKKLAHLFHLSKARENLLPGLNFQGSTTLIFFFFSNIFVLVILEFKNSFLKASLMLLAEILQVFIQRLYLKPFQIYWASSGMALV